jgi:cation:H+ antiporter
MVYLLFVIGFVLVIFGANFLVDGASSIAKRFKISNLVIGLTVVAFGTSAPELVVTVLAGINNSNEIALGNVVGSNIFNILLILGVAALIYPLTVHKNTVFKEIPLALLSAVLILVLGSDLFIDNEKIDVFSNYNSTSTSLLGGALSRIDGFVLLMFFAVFIFYVFATAKDSGGENEGEEIKELPIAKSVLYLLAGLTGLVFGGKWVVEGAVEIATAMGLSEKFVGLTIVAAGTSLPELATSIVAAYKRQTDIAIGNVVGSNIFNSFFILGIGAFLNPMPINAFAQADALVNIGASLLLFAVLFVGKRHTIGRFEGTLFLLAYVGYTVYLVMRG